MKLKQSKLFLFGTLLAASVVMVTAVANFNHDVSAATRADGPEYSISLGNISAAESTAKAFTRKSTGGADITFNTAGSVNALAGYVANMAYTDDNAIYNVTPITGLKEIRFQVANHANVKLMYGSDPDNLEYASETYNDTILNTDVVIDLKDAINARYFRFIHFRGTGSYLKTFQVVYSCSPTSTRGVAFDGGLSQAVSYTLDDVVTIDIKFTSDSSTKVALALLQDWSGNYFGYFNLYANGAGTYNGVSMRLLDDGYYRVTFDLNQITTISGSPTTVAVLFIHSDPTWTTATGYIDVEPTSKAVRTLTTDYAFTASTTITFAQSMKLPADKEIIIDIQFSKEDDAGKQIGLALATNWSNMYGYFDLKNDGTGTWSGVGVQTLGERHYRYYFDIDLLPKWNSSSPTYVDFIFANNIRTNANGTLSIFEII